MGGVAEGRETEGERPLAPSRLSWWGAFLGGAGLLGLGAVAALLIPRALAAGAVAVAALLVGYVVPWLVVRRVRARWRYPVSRGQVGKPVTVRLTVASGLPVPVFGLLLRGGWAGPAGTAEPLTALVPHLPAWGTREAALTVAPSRRGMLPRATATLATCFPFGFWHAAEAESEGHLLVWPEVVPLPAPALAAGEAGRELAAQRAAPTSRGEFHGVRPYRVGEPLRRVHWKQSARHDELVVWESRSAAPRAALVLVETAACPDGLPLEKALSVGASVASALVRAGLLVTLAFQAGAPAVLGNRQQLEAALDALARFSPEQGAGLDALLSSIGPGPSDWGLLVTTRAARPSRATPRPGLRVLLIDDGPAAAGAPSVPPDDPGNRKLQAAWKELTGANAALV